MFNVSFSIEHYMLSLNPKPRIPNPKSWIPTPTPTPTLPLPAFAFPILYTHISVHHQISRSTTANHNKNNDNNNNNNQYRVKRSVHDLSILKLSILYNANSHPPQSRKHPQLLIYFPSQNTSVDTPLNPLPQSLPNTFPTENSLSPKQSPWSIISCSLFSIL